MAGRPTRYRLRRLAEAEKRMHVYSMRHRRTMTIAALAAGTLLLAADGLAAQTKPATGRRARNAPAPRRLAPRLEPRALEILHAMGWRLANARTMRFTA